MSGDGSTPEERMRAMEVNVIRKAWAAADHPDHAIAREQLRQAVEAHRALLKELEVCPNCAPLLARVSATRVDGSEITSACVDCGSLDDPMWHERTWLDVRTGDTVRIVGSDNIAYVRHAVHQGWHVDPRSSEYRPAAMEWAAVHVELTAGPEHDAAVLGVLDMDPAKPILIQLTQSEVDAIELLGGGQNRLGMIMTEVPRP